MERKIVSTKKKKKEKGRAGEGEGMAFSKWMSIIVTMAFAKPTWNELLQLPL